MTRPAGLDAPRAPTMRVMGSTDHRRGSSTRPPGRRVLLAALATPIAGLALLPFVPEADPDPALSLIAWQPEPPSNPPADPPAESDEPALPADCEIVLDDGRRILGTLVESGPTTVVVEVGGIRTTYERARINELRIMEPVEDRYRALRRAIPDSDIDQRLMLAQWLMSRRAYRLAYREVDELMLLDPANPEIIKLRRHLELQIRLLEGVSPGEDRDNERTPQERDRAEFPLLSPEEINLLKVFEIDLRDPPRMLIPRRVVDELIAEHQSSELIPSSPEAQRALYRQPPRRILDLMFRLRARDLYGQVEVQGHPRSMERFRDDVHRGWLMRGCATSQCHGGQAAGRLWLHNQNINSDATVYTNFFILDHFKLEDGTPLINYDEPAKSPLLQMALPRARSERPHPVVSELGREVAWRPPLSGPEDDGFRKALRWLETMYRPRPVYPISYEPPVPAGAGILELEPDLDADR